LAIPSGGGRPLKQLLAHGFSPVLLLAVFLPQPITAQAWPAAVETQLQTALLHAGKLLEQGLGILAPQIHLQHVINCLEGPNGKSFKAAAGHVCTGQGNGILPDLKAAVAAKEKGADVALGYATAAWTVALEAVTLTDGNEVERRAKVIASHLQGALDALRRFYRSGFVFK
jgi:hypothetical protein